MHPVNMNAQPAHSHSLGEPGIVRVSQARQSPGWGCQPESHFEAICDGRSYDHLLPWLPVLG